MLGSLGAGADDGAAARPTMRGWAVGLANPAQAEGARATVRTGTEYVDAGTRASRASRLLPKG
ncbi:hypothetical protein GCM10027317_02080 [Massilia agri]